MKRTRPHWLHVIRGTECNSSASKTEKTMSRKNGSMNGSVVFSQNELTLLKTSISIAKGTLAILLSEQSSRLIKTSGATTQKEAHLQILLQDLMEEVWKMEAQITTSGCTSTGLSGKL